MCGWTKSCLFVTPPTPSSRSTERPRISTVLWSPARGGRGRAHSASAPSRRACPPVRCPPRYRRRVQRAQRPLRGGPGCARSSAAWHRMYPGHRGETRYKPHPCHAHKVSASTAPDCAGAGRYDHGTSSRLRRRQIVRSVDRQGFGVLLSSQLPMCPHFSFLLTVCALHPLAVTIHCRCRWQWNQRPVVPASSTSAT